MKMLCLALLALVLFLPFSSAGAGQRVIDDFEQGLRPGWEEKSFSGHTRYEVVTDSEGHCLRAESSAAASGLIYRIEFEPAEFPILRWRWKIDGIVTKGNGRIKAGDDYAARIYVIFPHWLFFKTRSLNYIWANRVPRGELLPNSFTANAMMISVESGSQRAGEWVTEERNLLDDFRRAFGEDPPGVGAVAVMTDTDNTGGEAGACYDDIVISSGEE